MTRREALIWLGALSGSLFLEPSARALARLQPVKAFIPKLRAVQISDIHYGYRGPGNPDPEGSLLRAFSAVRRLRPDILLVTGDLIQADRDATVRERRLREVWERIGALGLPCLAVPGEQDALPDRGVLWQRIVGPLHFHEERGGVHLIGLDNVSEGYLIGRSERQWLIDQVGRLDGEAPVLVMAHAPLAWFYPPWNWYTYDGPAVATLFDRFSRRLFVHGHVHQTLTDVTAGLRGFGCPAVSFGYPLPDRHRPAPLRPVAMPDDERDGGLGVRLIEFRGQFQMTEHLLQRPVVWGPT